MRSKEYWEGRFIELQRSQLKRADSFAHELEDLHQRMQKEIDDDITVWHKKVATANGISMADAKKLMSRKDRKEFQWTLEEYEQHAKADLLSGVTSAHVMNASANWHLTYLDGMKLQLEHHVDKLYKNIDSKTRNHFKESLNENYLNTAFELQKGIGIGEKMEVPYDERKLENILRTPWANDGKNFSQRIWKDRTQLVNNLQKNLSESVIRGESDTEMIQALSKDEKRAEFNTRRLIETESAYFDSMSEQECCEDFGVEKYRFLAVLDMKTSDICQELDNKVFLEKERQVGVNAPPMHPFCRSTTAPVIDEEFLTSRRAKNPKTGEYDEIPPEMNYKQWKEKYVDGKEPVKQEQVQTDTPNGYEFETKPLEQKTLEGETIHKDTTLPPKEKEEKFDSEAYENRVKKQAEKNNALIERIENNKDIPKELAEDIKANIRENEKLQEVYHAFGEENIELAQVEKNKNIKNVEQQIQPQTKSIQEEITKYLENNYKEIENVFLDDLDDNTVKVLKESIDKLNNLLIEATGKKVDIPINTIASNEKLYDLVIADYKNKYKTPGSEKELEEILFSKSLAFTPTPRNISKKNLWEFVGTNRDDLDGIYINKELIKGYDSKPKIIDKKHPPNCNTIQGIFFHEVGHTFDFKYNLADIQEIRDIYEKELNNYKNNIEEFTSEYSFKHKDLLQNESKRYREFIAENISEYLTSPKTARPTAVRVWNILIDKINTPKVLKNE